MAVAASLIPGFQYRIESGILEGEIVTIVDNQPFPDNDFQGRQRKVTVRLYNGDVEYILPRMMGAQPVGVDDAALPVQVAPQVVTVVPAEAVAESVPVTLVQAQARSGNLGSTPITDPMDPRLDQFRPSTTKFKYQPYITRDMPNGMTDIEFFLQFTTDIYRGENEGRPASITMKGDTQAGKTMLVEVLAIEWAKAMGLPKPMPIFTLSGSSGITDYDLFGQVTSYTDPDTGEERLVFLPGMADMAARVGGILLFDEVNMFSERVTSSLHPLCDHRHMFINRQKPVLVNGQYMPEVVKASFDLWIIANFNEGYRGTGDLNEAFLNRFRHILWDYDPKVEKSLVKSPAIHHFAERLRLARRANKIRTPIGTAALQRLERDVLTFGPAMGLGVVVGMFKLQERDIVESIIQDGSILLMLQDEAEQAARNAAAKLAGE